MNSKIAVCLVVLVMACGLALADEAPTPTNEVGRPFGRCGVTGLQYLSDWLNCHAFYECSNGTPHHFKCPRGTCWNSSLRTCDHNGSSQCRWPCNKL